MMKVSKFGGALLKDAAGIKRMGTIVSGEEYRKSVIVVSALGKTTNALENILKLVIEGKTKEIFDAVESLKNYHLGIVENLFLGKEKDSVAELVKNRFDKLWEILNNLPEDRYKAYDCVVSTGEQLSLVITGSYLASESLPVATVDACCFLVTDSNFTDASVQWKYTRKAVEARIVPLLEQGNMVLTQGFAGADLHGNTTTIGREGSDFTAAIIGSCIKAKEVTVWKNVPGLMTADPLRFPGAKQLLKVSYHEAIELAYYGASVVHPKTIQPLKESGIPLYIRSFSPTKGEPTLISQTGNDDFLPKIIVTDNQCLLTVSSKNLSYIVEENIKEIFAVFSKHKVHIRLMQNSAVSFSACFDADEDKINTIIAALKDRFSVKYNTGLTLVTLKNDDGKLYKQFTAGKTLYLKQESRNTVRFLIRE